jgi:VRR-NUC domain
MKGPESTLQISVIAYLRAVLPTSVRVHSSQNGLFTSKASAGKAKAEGMTSGVPDICLVRSGGLCAFIELKSKKGRLSENQIEYLDWCAMNGIPAAVCRSIDDVRDFLRVLGIGTREAI